MKIKISSKWLNKKCECNESIIKNICHGRCCGKKDLCICVTNKEKENLKNKFNCEIIDNKIYGKDTCRFMKNGLCELHNTEDKPIGCIFSPFKINKNNTLILRHRYIHFPCFKTFKETGTPAYITFAFSLSKIFGDETYKIIKANMEKNAGDFFINVNDAILEELNFLEDLK